MSGVLWSGGPARLPVWVELDGRRYRLRRASTVYLLDVISAGNWLAIFPGLLDPQDYAEVAGRVMHPDDDADYQELHDIGTTTGALLAGAVWPGVGPSWPGAVRLLATARARWLEFDGRWAGRGFDPLAGPLWRITGAVWDRLLTARVNAAAAGKSDQEVRALEQEVWHHPLTTGVLPSSRRVIAGHTPEQERASALAALREAQGSLTP